MSSSGERPKPLKGAEDPLLRVMAHPDPRVAQSARRMAHPVRHGPIWWLQRASAAASPRLARFLPKDQRRRDLAVVLVLLLAATAASASLPGGWAARTSAGPSAALVANLATMDPPATASDSPSPVTTLPEPTPTPSAPASAAPSPSSSSSPTTVPTPTPVPTKKPTPHVYTFVAMGDSLTSGYGDPGPAWPERLDAEDANLRLVNNAGVPGDTTAQMLARFNRDVLAYNPEVLFIMGGTNDLGHNISQATTIANLKAMIVAANAKGIRIDLMTVPPNASSGMADEIDSLNAAITHLGNSYRLVVIDIHSPLSTSIGTYVPRYTVDGLHFSAAGAQVVANTIYNRIHRYGF
jgi:lysophospholipase L1-like esterase